MKEALWCVRVIVLMNKWPAKLTMMVSCWPEPSGVVLLDYLPFYLMNKNVSVTTPDRVIARSENVFQFVYLFSLIVNIMCVKSFTWWVSSYKRLWPLYDVKLLNLMHFKTDSLEICYHELSYRQFNSMFCCLSLKCRKLYILV